MLGAIEIYNKPNFDYRNECFTILLINSWELVAKALLSKCRVSIYYRKRRGQPYRTLTLDDALVRANNRGCWPSSIDSVSVRRNLDLLTSYRDSAVHFYNADGFGVVIYALARTAIENYRDLVEAAFAIDIADEMNWELMPLGMRAPLGPIDYLQRGAGSSAPAAVREYIEVVKEAVAELEDAGADTGRFLTTFYVSLQSIKKISKADLVVGVSAGGDQTNPVLVSRRVDPNISHPLREKDVLAQVGAELHGVRFTPYTFRAAVFQNGWRQRGELCWQHEETGLTTWSREIVALLNGLTGNQLRAAREAYSAHMKAKRAS